MFKELFPKVLFISLYASFPEELSDFKTDDFKILISVLISFSGFSMLLGFSFFVALDFSVDEENDDEELFSLA